MLIYQKALVVAAIILKTPKRAFRISIFFIYCARKYPLLAPLEPLVTSCLQKQRNEPKMMLELLILQITLLGVSLTKAFLRNKFLQ